MMKSRGNLRLYGLVCALVLGLARTSGASVKWKPVDAQERAQSTGVVQADADAEAVFWDVRVTDELSMNGDPRTVLDHYLRIKVLTERGRDAQSTVDIPHGSGVEIGGVMGRTIKADGTIVELKKADVFERTIAKASGVTWKATSFVMPAVERGDLIEYQWRETRIDTLAMYIHLECQRDIPVQIVRYRIKPLSLPGFDYGIRIEAFNGTSTDIVKDKDERDLMVTTMSRVPAARSEPYMPAEHDVQPWLLIYYTPGGRSPDVDRFWKDYRESLFDVSREMMKFDDTVRAAAQTATAQAGTVAAKIEALLAICRTIRRIDLADSTARSDRKARSAKNAAEVLARREGDARELLMLFGALAQAAGLDARLAALPDRGEMAHVPPVGHPYFLTSRAIAIRDGQSWRFVNPANAYGPAGMLTPGQEGRRALVADSREVLFVFTPVAEPDASMRRRVLQLTLAPDGAVEGDAVLSYTGHAGREQREQDRKLTTEEREASVRDFFQARLPGAEVTGVQIEHLTDVDGDYTIRTRIRAPGVAEATAGRMFLPPAVLRQNAPALLPSRERTHPLMFSYAWSEHDEVTILLPEGYRADTISPPEGIEAAQVAGYRAAVNLSPDGSRLTYTRDLYFGANGRLEFPVNAYQAVKLFFDRSQEYDRYTMTLSKQQGGR